MLPEHLRALIVIMVLCGLVLWFARRVACSDAIAAGDYTRRAFAWIALTLLAFLTHYYWLYALISVPLLYVLGSKDSNRLAFCVFVLFAIPPFPADVPAFGGLGDFLRVDHLRWMSIAVLLPAWLSLRKTRDIQPFGRTPVDKAFIAYFFLLIGLQASETSVTNLIRISLGIFLDIFLPYYVASRALRDVRAYRDVLMSLAVAGLLLSVIASFEISRSWLLYNTLNNVLGLPYWGMGNYLGRGDGGTVRAIATAGHPIALGYLIAVIMPMLVFLRPAVSDRRMWLLAWFTLSAGLIAAMSRGPWVGAAAMLLILLFTGPSVNSNLTRTFVGSLFLGPLMLMTPQGQAIIDYLPWIGTTEVQNVDFRERLLQVSIGVLMNFPVFGSPTFLEHPDMQQMRGSDGIIDIVNTYLGVAMSTGFVGLTLFAMPFLLVILGIATTTYRIKSKQSDEHLLGRSLLAAMVGIVVTIGTVSPICAVQVVYVLVIGLGAGYLQMMKSIAGNPVLRGAAVRADRSYVKPTPRPSRGAYR